MPSTRTPVSTNVVHGSWETDFRESVPWDCVEFEDLHSLEEFEYHHCSWESKTAGLEFVEVVHENDQGVLILVSKDEVQLLTNTHAFSFSTVALWQIEE
jgi:hypothetical protein